MDTYHNIRVLVANLNMNIRCAHDVRECDGTVAT
jgi:hypothetical protein